MKQTIITKLEEMLSQPDASAVAHQMRTLQKEYQKLWTAEFETAKQTFVDEGGKAKEFEYAKHPDDVKIAVLFEKFEKKKKEEDAKIAIEQTKNLEIRKEIVSKINDLSQVSDNIGAAIKKLVELQALWKATGSVSPHKYKEIQADYSKAIEEFNYKLSLSKQLQEHDLKRNYELKTELLEKIRGIKEQSNIKEAERLIKIYRNDWEDIGPVPNDKWDELKGGFRAALEEAYSKLKAHYNSVEEEKEANLTQKKELLEKIKEIITKAETATGNAWNNLTNELVALQTEWKGIGRANQKENDKAWAEFRALCDVFFEKKKVFFSAHHEKMSEIKAIKQDLINKALALKDSKDWQKTGLALIKLQDAWKKAAHAGGDETKLFNNFRSVCNHFFDAKKAHFAEADAAFETNLVAKEELLKKLIEFNLSENSSDNHAALKQFSADWNATGMVPMKDKKRVNDAFYNRLDELYDKMNVSKDEKFMMQFKTKLERFANGESPEIALKKEADYLKKQIDEVNDRMKTYDNNLGFFKTSSKGVNPFLKEIEDKIAVEKQKIADFTEKRKMVIAELNKLKPIEMAVSK
jgi:archaellum component FlaC